MRKAAILFLFLVFLSASGAAQLNSAIESGSCPDGYEAVVSMANPDAPYNNPGPPEMYEHKVCVTGITDVQYGNSCRETPAFYISSNSTHAHFSSQPGYNMKVCAGRMITRVKNQCSSNQTALFSVSDKINGFGRHVAGTDGRNPKVFSNIVCGFYRPPENVSLSLQFNLSNSDEIYFDGEQRDTEFSYSGLAEFPYLVSTSGSHTAGIVATQFRRVERKLENKNILTMRKSVDDPSFIVPFTEEDHTTIESSQQELFDGEFMAQLDPSFSFPSPTQPVVRTVLDSPVDIRSNLSISKGSFRLKIEKTGENQVTLQTE